jgi:CRISPR-associated protein Csx17
LIGESSDCELPDELGFPFFPDAIKSYNQGGAWVQSSFKFNPLDYVLAMEGAFALRGSVARQIGARSKRFAAFPFVFETGEALTDGKEMKSAAAALWLPVWTRPTSFEELSSFIADAQARLPNKEVRFSGELARALHSQGVDAAFTGWQEFRFKLKSGSGRVPWVTTGSYVESAFREEATRLNRGLRSLDESHFLDQLEPYRDRKTGKLKKDGPHTLLEPINAAMETTMRETTPLHCLELLCTVFSACRQMAISESFRDTLPGKRARFFRPLPMEEWNSLLGALAHYDRESPREGAEFRIARAVASMAGAMKQRDGKFSEVLPVLGSLLPLKLEKWGWRLPLPPKEKPSKQAVWTGTEVCHDLAAVLARRYMDSLNDDRPALVPPHDSLGARLGDVLAFLNRELDDQAIARWIEALSLIGWEFAKLDDPAASAEPEVHAIPPEYAALRTLFELECERREEGDTKKRRSQQPIGLLCQRSASTLALAVTEALRWIAIWGVPNPDREQAREGKERLAGRDIVDLSNCKNRLSFISDAGRLPAAVCIPLHWRDRNALYRAVSLPQAH